MRNLELDQFNILNKQLDQAERRNAEERKTIDRLRGFAARYADETRLRGIEFAASVWANSLLFQTRDAEQARTVIKVIGGKWDKRFDDATGKFMFTREVNDDMDGLHVYMEVGPSGACKVKPVVKTVTETHEVTRYVLEGDCEPLLAD